MNGDRRQKRIWKLLYALVHCFVPRRFRLDAELCRPTGPCLIVANHVTTWDPLLLSMSFPDTPIRFVASEHIFRHGLASRLLERLVAPIPRRKGSTGTDTVRACLRALREGQTVCIFAEGDACWDGLTHAIFPATGKLARASGAALITYRLEGGYLSLPRWSKRLRRGRMRGRVAGLYPPEALAAMSGEEIDALIERDIFEDAWQRQREEHVRFRGSRRAEGIEQGFFLCPDCGAIGSVRGVGDRVVCPCGLDLLLGEEGFFEPPVPVETLAEWDSWQQDRLRHMAFAEGEALFSDDAIRLCELDLKHGTLRSESVTVTQTAEALLCGAARFALDEIGSMAMVKANILLLTVGERYFELRAERPRCLRKYLAVWQNAADGRR